MKGIFKFALGFICGVVSVVWYIILSAKSEIQKKRQIISSALKRLGLAAYNQEGKRAAKEMFEAGTGLGFLKITSISQVDSLSDTELETVFRVICKIYEKRIKKKED